MASAEYMKKYKKEHPEYVRRYKDKYYSRSHGRINGNKKWEEEELQMILDHNISDTELAKKFERSVESIQVIRAKIKSGNGLSKRITEMKLNY